MTNAQREELVIDLELAMQMVLKTHEARIDAAMERTCSVFAHTIAELARPEVFCRIK